jgi:DNA-binding protein H-NS
MRMSKPSLTDLLAQKAELERQIAETQRAERNEAIAQVKTLMAQFGLTLADIGAKPATAGRAAPSSKPAAKVAVKYRDSSTGQTWTGRGLQPNWLKAALASGRPLSDFAV